MPASFRTVRWIRTINLVLQAVLFLTLFAGLNYVAKNHPSRFDLTATRRFSLSPETLSYVRNLERPVRIVVTQSEEEANPEVFGLVNEFVHATEGRPGKIITETIDIYRDRRRSEELGIDTANVIVLFSGEKRRVVRISELYGMKEGRRETFRGEQQLTAAILDVSSLGRKKIYFLVGHTEFIAGETGPFGG
ncbi:MAG: Gldg family protein, partial [Verrucomicrobiota bacterium]